LSLVSHRPTAERCSAELEFVIPANALAEARTAGHLGASLPTLVLTAFAAVLDRRIGQDAVTVGVPISPRVSQPMPIRIDLSGEPRCAAIVRQVPTN
jgi:non-ribosomal peptide synthetase component F